MSKVMDSFLNTEADELWRNAPPMPLEIAAVAFFMAAMLVLSSPDSLANALASFSRKAVAFATAALASARLPCADLRSALVCVKVALVSSMLLINCSFLDLADSIDASKLPFPFLQ